MATIAPILCKACKKDISSAKRVRSPQGHFYCEACCAAAAARKARKSAPAAAPAQVPAPAPPAPAAPPVPAPARVPAPATARTPAGSKAAAPARSGPREPLTRCPNCDAPIIPGRPICIKCRLDTTKMDDIIARRSAIGQGSTEEKVGALFSRAIKGAGVLLILLILAGAGYMVYELMHPGTVFDNYPTTRDKAVREMLGDIAEGSEKGYQKAYELVSFRLHNPDNPNDAGRYKMVYSRMHDEFASKYGADWPSKAKIERDDDADNTQSEVTYRVTLNKDTYHVVTEGQTLITNAVQMMDSHETFPEDGKHHFGIADIEEYSLIPKGKGNVDLKKFMEQMRQMQEHRGS